MRYGVRGWKVGAAAVLAGAGWAFAGPDWLEQGDAGAELATAQAPTRNPGASSLNTVSGILTGTGLVADMEDCYLIRIVNPAIFSATITSANFNTQLFLFNISVPGGAYGLLANNDQSPTNNLSRFTNLSNDGTNVILALPGDYMLAVSGAGRNPIAPSGGGQFGQIFLHETLTEISGPDGPGGFNQHTGWTGTGETGNYTITLTGCDFPVLPTPSAAGVLAMAGIMGLRRKR